MFKFKDNIVVVTGGEQGIGKAIAKAFSIAKAKVIIVGINEITGEKTAKELNGEVTFIKTDVSNLEEVEKLPNKVEEIYGLTDILINNAGIYIQGNVENTSVYEWDKIMNINLKGVFLVTKYILNHMLKKRKGTIVNIASEAGLVAFKNQVAYNVSKAAVISFTKSIAIDFAKNNIRANVVCPGTTITPLFKKLLAESEDPEEIKRQFESLRPLNRLGKPEEIAMATLCLASNKLAYATGSVFSIDGGYTAQ